MSKSDYCRKPDYLTQKAGIPFPTTEDVWFSKNVENTVTWYSNAQLANATWLFNSVVHVNRDAARGCIVGFLPKGSFVKAVPENVNVFNYKCLEKIDE